MKASLEIVDNQADILYDLSHVFPRPDDAFSKMWKAYLQSVGWTEEEYDQELFNKE
jgi:hypothetical protein